MNWSDLAGRVIGLGAPLLGGALAGPFGAAAGTMLANALGAPDATPVAVNSALAASKDASAAAEAARQAESEWLAAMAEIGKAQVAEVGATQRAEIASDNLLQSSWRPIYALELCLVECPAFVLALLRALWTGHEAGINGFASLSAILVTYFTARLSVLGIYVTSRSKEKQANATGELPPSVIGDLVKAFVNRK